MARIESFAHFINADITIPTIAVYAEKNYINGAKRNIMDIRIPENIDYSLIERVLENEDYLKKIELTQRTYSDDDSTYKDSSYIHEHYTIFISKGLDTVDGTRMLRLKLARLTDEEIQFEEIRDQVRENTMGIIDLAGKV